MQKVLIDSDTGLDDAMALVHGFLSDEIEIIGITSVFGNGEMVDCAYHALEIINIMGKSVPVIKGAGEPLIGGCGAASHVHGTYARGPLGKLDLEDQITPGYAPVWMLEQIQRYGEELTIVAMGRLTNLALAARIDPDLMRKVGHIYWMGGSVEVAGNTGVLAEANAHGDPEAAKIVCTSNLPLTILPLDATMSALITDADVEAMKAVQHPGVQYLTEIVPYYIDFYETMLGTRECVAHCGLLLALVMDPSLITKAYHLPADVEVHGELTRAQLVVDRRSLWNINQDSSSQHGVRIVMETDVARYHAMFMGALLGADRGSPAA